MLFSLDYDNTWTKTPELWKQTIQLFREHGHDFVCVTSRPKTSANQEEMGRTIGQYMPIVFCNHTAKKRQAKESGFNPDVWIDDRPETIPTSARQWKRNSKIL